MKLIRDPIHGEIAVDDTDLDLLDSPEVQRLRRIKQIGLGHLVYPGANHTRFEHSVGTMYVAGQLCDRMGFDEGTRRKMVVSALLHDLGHGPFSHTTEKFSSQVFGLDHSELTLRGIVKGPISEVLAGMDLDPTEIGLIASGRGHDLAGLLHSQVGLDRMDYLMRDAHYTGVAYGVIDHQRILSTLIFRGGEIMIREKGSQAAESLLVARFLMYPSVYLHHVSRIADAMLFRALEDATARDISVEEIMGMDDMSLVSRLLQEEGLVREMVTRILNRSLYKRAVYAPPSGVQDLDSLIELSRDRGRLRELEDEISAEAGIEPGGVLIDVQDRPRRDETEIKVLSGSEVSTLGTISTLVKSLRDAEWNYWRFGVYCAKENLEKVREVCVDHGWPGLER